MADEITPEQWRAWGEDPCTQRLLAKLEDDAQAWDELAARARVRAIAELDGKGTGFGGNLLSERNAMQDYRQVATLARSWATAIRKMFDPEPSGIDDTPPAGRRVSVKG